MRNILLQLNRCNVIYYIYAAVVKWPTGRVDTLRKGRGSYKV